MQVTLYSRKDCHLCEEALDLLERARSARPFEFTVVDVDADPLLRDRYDWRVPVIAVDGVEITEGIVDEARILSALAAG